MTSVAFSHDGTLLAAGGNGIAVWNTRSRRPAERPINASGGGMRLAFDPHGNRLASAGDGNVVRLWDVRTGRLLEPPLAGHRSSISSLAFDREGTRLVSTDTTGGIRLWDMRPERRLIRSREGLPGARLPAGDSLLAISPSGDLVAAVDAAGAFRVSDARTRRAQPIGLRGGEVVVAAAFSRDGARLAIADGENFTVRIVDPRSGRAVGRALPVDAVALALDRRGDRLAIGSFDGSVQLWNPRLGVRMASAFVAAPDGIASLAFTPDARTLAVGDDSGAVRFWDLGTRRPLGAAIKRHSVPIAHLAFDDDGATLASTDDRGTVQLWDSILWTRSRQALESRLCSAVGHGLTPSQWERLLPGEPYHETCPPG